jgi:IS30 family transposase
MTGDEFRKQIEDAGVSRRQLAKRWGVAHTTVNDECKKDEVRGLYRDAIRQVRREKVQEA